MRDITPKLCFIGHMLGQNSGYVTTQGQIVADLLSNSGYVVSSASSRKGRLFRMCDMIQTVISQRNTAHILIVEVYSGLSFVMADVVSWLGARLKLRTIGVLHGGNLPNLVKASPRRASRVLRRFSRLVSPSAYLANEVKRHGFCVSVIPNAVDVGTYPYRSRQSLRPRLMWMRAFHSIYNPELALRTLALLLHEHPEATLVMAGVDKGLERSIKTLAEEMGLAGAVRFPGFLDHSAKVREFSEADIYLNTSRIDNMPVTVIEACAMGLPVVAANVGGLSHLINEGENGLLVPDNDAPAMATAVSRLLRQPALAKRLSKNGRLLAERSSWPLVRERWEHLFDELMAQQPRSINSKLLEQSTVE